MRSFTKVIAVIFIAAIITGLFSTSAAKAAGDFIPDEFQAAKPEFKLKRINSGTGVKVVIEPTERANYYTIYITNTKNTYSKYMYNNGQEDRIVKNITANPDEKTVLKIEGLPKGSYTFMVEACRHDYRGMYVVGSENYSVEKTIRVKGAKKIPVEEKEYDFSKVKAGDIIKFGSYEQDDNMVNGTEPIEWIVLNRDSDKILVLSKYALDAVPFTTIPGTTWETSTIRKWLGKVFYKSAFSESEKNYIMQVTNESCGIYHEHNGNATKDKLFFLSFKDVTTKEVGLCENTIHCSYDIARRCAPTKYALTQGCKNSSTVLEDYKKDYITKEEEYACCWWLRNTESSYKYASYVYYTGGVKTEISGLLSYVGVRPAMYIKLK